MVSLFPVNLQRDGASRCLVIQWNDGREHRLPYRKLRDRCPCASCRTPDPPNSPAGPGLRILTPAETRPLEIVTMSPVGNYAYHIEFSDQHNTGIFTFDLLRSLADEP